MEPDQITSKELPQFLASREKEILAMAMHNTEEVVKREMALADFEVLISINTDEAESAKISEECRALRQNSWDALSKEFNGDYDKMCRSLNDF